MKIPIDISAVGRRLSRDSILEVVKKINYSCEVIEDFWLHYTGDTEVSEKQVLVFSDLHFLAGQIERTDRDLWAYRIKKLKPFFITLMRNNRDLKVAGLIHDVMRDTENRISVIRTKSDFKNTKEQSELQSEISRILNRYFNPEGLNQVTFNKTRKIFYLEFNDGIFGEVSLKDLDLQKLEKKLLLDSPSISEQGDAVLLFTKEGEIFDIDALLLKSLISPQARSEIIDESKLTARNLGKVIRSTRLGNKLTQQELAGITDIDQAIISKIETGKHLPRFDTLQRLADGFRISISEMLQVIQVNKY